MSFTEMKICTKCRLHNSRTQVVTGKGPLDANIVIISEAPGRVEDETGIPFNNKEGAGKILSALLSAANIRREEVYITNIVKCRPPNNRVPDLEEIEACKEHLKYELELVKPKVILALGDVAALVLTGKSVNKWRGFIFSSNYLAQIPTLVTYHPAYFTYGERQNMFSIVANDFEKLNNLDFFLKEVPTNYLINPSAEITDAFLKKNSLKTPVVDIETVGDKEDEDSGLNPWKDQIVGIAVGYDVGSVLQLNGSHLKEQFSIIKRYLEDKSGVFQNNTFDRMFLKMNDLNMKCSWDTQTGMYIINPNSSKKLDFLRSLYTNIEPYKTKENYKFKLEWVNCRDVDVTNLVHIAQQPYVNKKLMQRIIRLDDVAIMMRYRGVKVDKMKLAEHYALLYPRIAQLEKEFNENYGVDILSPKQLSQLFFDRFKLPYNWKSKKKTLISTDDDSIEYILQNTVGEVEGLQAVRELQEYREQQKIASVYCEGVFKMIQEDGKLHPDWRPIGTDTGRWACKRPNMQNFPKHMRDVIVPSTTEHIFIGADYNKLEIGISGILANDYDLVETWEKNYPIWDILLEEVERIYPLTQKVGATQAKLRVKAIVYGTYYGRQVNDIALEFKTDPRIVQMWLDAFFNKYTKLKRYFENEVEFWKKNGYIETPYGRRKYCKKVTEAMNTKIQSVAADVVHDANIKLNEEGFNVILNVHDQLVSEELRMNDRYDKFINILKHSSPQIHHIFGVDGNRVENWKEV
jgi:uracil-DNA glycosylase family 4